ncbi:MAG: hypothetical protein NTW02_00950, partial [Cyanobium sp. LacPavin_0920_WC12_MAG_62_9]|nr:hypothetical protein [Cyanobium sp. LacPavin_0920_WC12_MAG_62_9]
MLEGLILSFWQVKSLSQIIENTNNRSSGNSSSFTITVNSTHGISSSASKTPDFNVTNYGNMFVVTNSTSIQQNEEGAQGFIQSNSNGTVGQTKGISGFQRVNFGEGTEYRVNITPVESSKASNGIGTASGSSTGSVSTTIT